MPWDVETYDAVCAGLRKSAAAGEFVPYEWVADVESDDNGGCRVFGCGWGIVGWTVAVANGGVAYAADMLPIGSGQKQVNHVLRFAGLTRREIKRLNASAAWRHFDNELDEAYDNRHGDPDAFIEKSVELAEYFVKVLSRVPVASKRTAAETSWKKPSFFGIFSDAVPKAETFKLAA